MKFVLSKQFKKLNTQEVKANIDLLLHGNKSFSYHLNKEIFQAVHQYKSDNHRFI
jgi:hypothetical protein